MKTKFLFFSFMLICMACADNKPLTDSDKQKIIGEVKPVNEALMKAFEKCNTDTIRTILAPSEGMMYPFGLKMMTYTELSDAIRYILGTMNYQKHTMISENYAVLDKNTVWYSEICKWEVYYKDGKVLTQNPWYFYALYKKTGNTWKVATMTENGHSEITKADTLKKEINQLDLLKQWIGTWKYELSKDSSVIVDYQLFGKGLTGNAKLIVKGNPASAGQRGWGYSRPYDALVRSTLNVSGNASTVAYWFKTPTTYSGVPHMNITNPSESIMSYEGEFVTKDKVVEKILQNGKVIRTYTYNRIK